MQELFGLETTSFEGLNKPPLWDYVKRGLKENLNTAIAYNQRWHKRVDGSHFLIRLIYSMAVPKALPSDRFYNAVRAKGLGLSMAMKMTSSLYKGQVFDGVFYGDGSKEILIAHDEEFDFADASRNWKLLEPIKVLYHPKSDLNFDIPDGVQSSQETGLAVIAINVPMLIYQYREFRREQEYFSELTGENPRSISNFIYSYPLTNMLKSQLDSVIFNRIYNLLNGIPIGISSRRNPFMLPNYDRRLHDVHVSILKNLKSYKPKFNTILKSVPLVSCEDLKEFSKLPECVHTRQVVWGLVAARLKILSFIYNACGDDPRRRNSTEINIIDRRLNMMKTDKALNSSLPIDLYLDAKRDLDNINPPT